MAPLRTETFGGRLRRLREARGLSWHALAAAAGTTPDALYRIARGDRDDPKLSTLCGLADALGITLDQLAGRAPSTTP